MMWKSEWMLHDLRQKNKQMARAGSEESRTRGIRWESERESQGGNDLWGAQGIFWGQLDDIIGKAYLFLKIMTPFL